MTIKHGIEAGFFLLGVPSKKLPLALDGYLKVLFSICR